MGLAVPVGRQPASRMHAFRGVTMDVHPCLSADYLNIDACTQRLYKYPLSQHIVAPPLSFLGFTTEISRGALAMAVIKRAVAVAALLSCASALPKQTRPFERRQDLPPADERAKGVVDTFRTAWDGYMHR
jgi:hypothetical protein